MPNKVTQLRHIPLCTVLFKIITKLLSNRMKSILNDVISLNQSAFIWNRLISDNLLIAHEIGHYINRHRTRRVGVGALKIDMSKAYDRLDWGYLRVMLCKLGFPDKFINIGMLTVTSVRYQIWHDGGVFFIILQRRGEFDKEIQYLQFYFSYVLKVYLVC